MRLVAKGYIPAETLDGEPFRTKALVNQGLIPAQTLEAGGYTASLYTREDRALMAAVAAGMVPKEALDSESFRIKRLINQGLIPRGGEGHRPSEHPHGHRAHAAGREEGPPPRVGAGFSLRVVGRERRFAASAGQVQDRVRVRSAVLKLLDGLGGGHDHQIHMTPARLLPHLVHDRERAARSAPHHQSAARPRDVLARRQRRVAERCFDLIFLLLDVPCLVRQPLASPMSSGRLQRFMFERTGRAVWKDRFPHTGRRRP